MKVYALSLLLLLSSSMVAVVASEKTSDMIDIVFRSFEDETKKVTLSIDPDSSLEVINSNVARFLEDNVDFAGQDGAIKALIDKRLRGIRLKGHHQIDGICGKLISDIDAAILEHYALEVVDKQLQPAGTFLYAETGSYKGCSSILMSGILPANALLYAHDLWINVGGGDLLSQEGDPPAVDSEYFYEFYQNVRDRDLESRIIPIRGNSSFTMGMHEDNSISFGFIDGDHSFDGVMADLTAMYPKIKPGGILVLHDVINVEDTTNPAALAVRRFCKDLMLYCELMIMGTEIARVYKSTE
jgi:hypothetical protein